MSEHPMPWYYDAKPARGGLAVIRDNDGCRVCMVDWSDVRLIVAAVNGAHKRRETLKAKGESK